METIITAFGIVEYTEGNLPLAWWERFRTALQLPGPHGLLMVLAIGQRIDAMLFGVEGRDPGTLLTVAAVLIATSLAASYVPARRAARIQPMTVLREE